MVTGIRLRRIPLPVCLPPLILLTAAICLEVFLVQSMHEAWKAVIPDRLARLILLDFSPVMVTIALAVWMLSRLDGTSIVRAIRETGILHANRWQILVAGAVACTWTGWHLWIASLLDAEMSITRKGSYVLWLAVHTAIREELVFRGVVLQVLRRGRSAATAAAWSALLFALAHSGKSFYEFSVTSVWTSPVAVWQVVHPFFFGLLMARLVQRGGGSLWGPIAIHFALYVEEILPVTFPGTPEKLALEFWMRHLSVGVFCGMILLATEWMPGRGKRFVSTL